MSEHSPTGEHPLSDEAAAATDPGSPPPPAWAPSDVPPRPGPPPAPPAHGDGSGGRTRGLLLGAAVGAVCAALVVSGAFLVFGRDSSTRTVTVQASSPQITRESQGIGNAPDVASLVAKVEPSVVAITANQGGGQRAAGTGFVISPDGYIVTNAHVVGDASTVKVDFNDGKSLDAKVAGRDVPADIGLLKVDVAGLPVVQLGDSDKVQVGDSVVAIGNALALEGGPSVTQGIISGPPRSDISVDTGNVLESALQTDAAINPGNSGGPLVDAQGKVIAINTAAASPMEAQNVGFAIPMNHAVPIIDDLKAGRKPAFLGVGSVALTPELKAQLHVKTDTGAVVQDVRPGTPAEKAGIRRGDVIVQIGEDQIKSGGDVAAAVRKHRPGDTVAVVFERGGDRKTVPAALVERPDSA